MKVNCGWLVVPIDAEPMSLDEKIASPHRISHESPVSCSTILQRHRFLLIAMGLLTFICIVYLYFAVTLGSDDSCSGLTATEKAASLFERSGASLAAKEKL
ncbi:unnamed protein product [Cuscuta epithymum]|uniref:Uncharacterized protein n=1 Tax=Cuscuta epithymum TaxID=186058 RepID=A0AAV0DE13_9ASTE|nr:unnamed protein product [Cuscuta epithymum]